MPVDPQEIFALVAIVLASLLPIFITVRARSMQRKGREARDARAQFTEPSPILSNVAAQRTAVEGRRRPSIGSAHPDEDPLRPVRPVRSVGSVSTARSVKSPRSVRGDGAVGSVRPSRASGYGWVRIESLPRLKKAIVLAEVLRPPKSIDPKSYPRGFDD